MEFLFFPRGKSSKVAILRNQRVPSAAFLSPPTIALDFAGIQLRHLFLPTILRVFDSPELEMFDYIAFDVETTGTVPRVDEIVEIGAVRFEKGKPVKEFGSLVNPNRKIPEEAGRVHGISNEMEKDAPPLPHVLEQFAAFCGDTILVAHNAPFDVKFIGAGIQKHKTRSPMGQVLDTYQISKQSLPNIFSHRLENLVKHFNISSSGFHRAVEDSAYCGQVFVKLLMHLKESNQKLRFENIENLSGGKLFFPRAEVDSQMGLF